MPAEEDRENAEVEEDEIEDESNTALARRLTPPKYKLPDSLRSKLRSRKVVSQPKLETSNDTSPEAIVEEEEEDAFRIVPLADLATDPDQARKIFDEETLKELASSIRQNGILQPLVVCPIDGSKYKILAGERRFKAAGMAGLGSVPCVIREFKEDKAPFSGLVENMQREDLSAPEKVMAIKKLAKKYSAEKIAAQTGIAERTVFRYLQALTLSDEVQGAFFNGEITIFHVRALLSLRGDTQKQKRLLEKILQDGLTGAQAQKLAKEWAVPRSSTSGVRRKITSFKRLIGNLPPEKATLCRGDLKELIKEIEDVLQSLSPEEET